QRFVCSNATDGWPFARSARNARQFVRSREILSLRPRNDLRLSDADRFLPCVGPVLPGGVYQIGGSLAEKGSAEELEARAEASESGWQRDNAGGPEISTSDRLPALQRTTSIGNCFGMDRIRSRRQRGRVDRRRDHPREGGQRPHFGGVSRR